MIKVDIKKMEDSEMWLRRQMLEIKWSDKVRNEDALQLIEEDRVIINSTKLRKQEWTGHVWRHKGMFRDVIEGRLLGQSQQEDDATRYWTV